MIVRKTIFFYYLQHFRAHNHSIDDKKLEIHDSMVTKNMRSASTGILLIVKILFCEGMQRKDIGGLYNYKYMRSLFFLLVQYVDNVVSIIAIIKKFYLLGFLSRHER